ncbi:MAG TPA: ABC transporter substrate-binding protein [bacterium]|nr:ABC transporter substrate-binding protein [bacterium]
MGRKRLLQGAPAAASKQATDATREGETIVRMSVSRRDFLGISAGAVLADLLAASRAPAAEVLTSLKVGMSFSNLDAVAAWIAEDKHFFERYGLTVSIINIQGGAKTVAAMAAGDVPIAFIAAADIINARVKGLPLEMIGGLINRFPYDFVVAKNITTPSQLKGAKGAISGFGSSSDFAVRYALTKLGVDPQDVTLLQAGNETSRLAALSSGQIQFTVLTAGLDLAAFDLGYKPLVKLYTLDQPYQHTGIAANITWAKAHPALVAGFLKAVVTANVFIKNRLNIAAALALIHPHLPIKEGELREGFQLYRDQFYSVYPLVTQPGLEFILRARKIDQAATDFFDNSYVQALQDSNFAATVEKAP